MKKTLLFAALLAGSFSLVAQTPAETAAPKADGPNVFTTEKSIKISSIEDQANSGTCWAYSANSFLEAEILRMGKPKQEISEMFVVNHCYREKGDKYVRLHGKLNFGQGGSFGDAISVLRDHGAVPQEIMLGLNYGTTKNAHSELSDAALGFLKEIVKNPNGKLSTAWKRAYNGIIDSYLGEIPETFTYNGKSYTPKSYAAELGLNPDDYISIASYTHHPFYTQFPLEIEDNWRWQTVYNVPIAELMAIIENAADKGFPVAWGGDVSENGFTRNGIAVLADVEAIETAGSDQARWVGLDYMGRMRAINEMINTANCPEINPTQEYRQEAFDNFTLTDDHGMMLFGVAKNQNGRKFYMIQNSWGGAGDYDGVWYMSENYVAGRTMNIVLHKDAIPANIAKKMGIKK